MIAFVGSVFSPGYFRTRRRRLDADPTLHCGLNVVVHGEHGDHWAMSEYRGTDVQRSDDALVLGRNCWRRVVGGLDLELDERGSPWPRALRGRVRLRWQHAQSHGIALDGGGRHLWWPIAPTAAIEVELDAPRLRFRGSGYHDGNAGIEPLEQALRGWSWSRARVDGGVALLYDVIDRDGAARPLGLFVGDDGTRAPLSAPRTQVLPRTRWRIDRGTRTDAGADARLLRSLVDTPFYARALIETSLRGRVATAVHEVVDLRRFSHWTTQLMLPFRIRGVGWW
ncbi:MAG: carotenoid 1,2-hydratase [Nannocystaceae bacterium]|nr:carotenoid 1,2-hydratase [Nannocystaceae bacterium]